MSEPKIHHKTLEAMKRREAEQSVSPTEIGWEEDVVIKKSMVDNLLSRIESLEQEKNIKPVSEAMKREIYKWACQFSFFLFSRNDDNGEKDIPIVDYRSMKLKQDFGWYTYKDPHGNIQNNQVIKLSLADGTTENVEPFYLANAKASTKAYPLFIEDTDGNRVKGDTDSARNVKNISFYVFSSEYGEIKIPPKLITTAFTPST